MSPEQSPADGSRRSPPRHKLGSPRRKRPRDADGSALHLACAQPSTQRMALSGRAGRGTQLKVFVPSVDVDAASEAFPGRPARVEATTTGSGEAPATDASMTGGAGGQQQLTPSADVTGCQCRIGFESPARIVGAPRPGTAPAAPPCRDAFPSPAPSPPGSVVSDAHRAFVRHLLAAASAAEELRASGQRIGDETSTRTLGCILRSVASECDAMDLDQATPMLTLPNSSETCRGGLRIHRGIPEAHSHQLGRDAQQELGHSPAGENHFPGVPRQPQQPRGIMPKHVEGGDWGRETLCNPTRSQAHDHASASERSAAPAVSKHMSRAQLAAPRHSETATPEATPLASPLGPALGLPPWATGAPLLLGEQLRRQAAGEPSRTSFSGSAWLSGAFRPAPVSGVDSGGCDRQVTDFAVVPELSHFVAQEKRSLQSPTRAAAEEWRRALAGPESPLFPCDSPCPSPSTFLASSKIGPFTA